VEFMDYSTRYQEDRDPVLRDITTKIKGGEKVRTHFDYMIYCTHIIMLNAH